MFGYITICEPELKVKDLKKYRAYYCGLCRVLKEKYGFTGQMTLTYDMTFALILLSSLYETASASEFHRCKAHPVKKRLMIRNEITEYTAAMNMLLAYHHMDDDWRDDGKLTSLAGKKLLERKVRKIAEAFPRQNRAVEKALHELAVCEKEKCTDLDRISGCFGSLMEEIFLYRLDQWEEPLRRMGFFLGKYIYIMDAYEDLEKDIQTDRYNPLRSVCREDNFEIRIYEILCMMIGESTAEFEKLPCIWDVDILRNILYDGVWFRYNKIQSQKREDNSNVKKSV